MDKYDRKKRTEDRVNGVATALLIIAGLAVIWFLLELFVGTYTLR